HRGAGHGAHAAGAVRVAGVHVNDTGLVEKPHRRLISFPGTRQRSPRLLAATTPVPSYSSRAPCTAVAAHLGLGRLTRYTPRGMVALVAEEDANCRPRFRTRK